MKHSSKNVKLGTQETNTIHTIEGRNKQKEGRMLYKNMCYHVLMYVLCSCHAHDMTEKQIQTQRDYNWRRKDK